MSAKLIFKGDWTFSIQKSFILNPKFSVGAKTLYAAIKSFCSPKENTAFPSTALLSKSLAISRDTVLKYSKELQEAGLLEATQSVAAKGRFSHTIYVLHDYDRSGKCPLRTKPVAENVDTKTSQNNEEDEPDISPATAGAPPVEDETAKDMKKRHNEFTALWCAEHEATFKRPYKHQGAQDGAAIKRLVHASGQTPEQLMAVARLAWRFPKLFNCKQAASLTGFDSRFNEIVAEVAHLLPKTGEQTKPKSGPEDL